MKKLKTFLSIGLLTLLTACGTTNSSTDGGAADSPMTNRGRSSAEVLSTGKPVSKKPATTENTKALPPFGNTDAANKVAMDQMYSHLNMNDDQISSFERGWKSETDTWKKTNPNKSMNNFERTEAQDRILKNILDDSQFTKYQEWARQQAE